MKGEGTNVSCEPGGLVLLARLLYWRERWEAEGRTVEIVEISAGAESAAMEAVVDGESVYRAVWA